MARKSLHMGQVIAQQSLPVMRLIHLGVSSSSSIMLGSPFVVNKKIPYAPLLRQYGQISRRTLILQSSSHLLPQSYPLFPHFCQTTPTWNRVQITQLPGDIPVNKKQRDFPPSSIFTSAFLISTLGLPLSLSLSFVTSRGKLHKCQLIISRRVCECSRVHVRCEYPRRSFKMWRRAYLFLVLVRLYFALSPSYLHPDENFQGPEVIAGMSQMRSFSISTFMTMADVRHVLLLRIKLLTELR